MSENAELTFLENPNYKTLCGHYINNPIALYTGAGVSWSDNPKYGLRGWDELVKEILVQHKGSDTKVVLDYDIVLEEYAEEPWKLADWVKKRIGRNNFKTQVVNIIQRKENFPERQPDSSNQNQGAGKKRKYKQLGRPFLKQAPTLNSVCAFCARITAEVKDTTYLTYQIAPNPRIRAIVTSNYDPFLEAASSTMFQKILCKPVGAYGSSGGDLDQIPVYHIHGYVPYPETNRTRQKKEIPSMVDPVLTTEDYENAWKNRAFNFTMGPQIHILRHYCALFVGFSFRDHWVNDLLRILNKEREIRGKHRLFHYALMRDSEISKRGNPFFKDLGIKPIGLKDYNQVPAFFKSLYLQPLQKDYKTNEIPLPLVNKQRGKNKDNEGLKSETIISKDNSPKMTLISADNYWEHLYKCRNRTVGSRKKHQ